MLTQEIYYFVNVMMLCTCNLIAELTMDLTVNCTTNVIVNCDLTSLDSTADLTAGSIGRVIGMVGT